MRSERGVWFDAHGSRHGPTVLLLSRMGAQGFEWAPELIELLTDAGYRVLTYDARGFGRTPNDGPYAFEALVDDAVSVLDADGVESVHLVGTSMGGVVARSVHDRRPQRVETLTLLSSSTGDGSIPVWTPEFAAVVATPPSDDPASVAEYLLTERRAMSDEHFDEVAARAAVQRVIARGWSMRSLRFVARAMTERDEYLTEAGAVGVIEVPVLIVHGTIDAVLPLAHGDALHAAVPCSRYVVVDGMNHDLQAHHLASVTDALLEHLGASR